MMNRSSGGVRKNVKIIVALLLSLSVSITMAAILSYTMTRDSAMENAEKDLRYLKSGNSLVIPRNIDSFPYDSEKVIEGASPDQKSLGEKTSTESPSFIFTNSESDKNPKEVHLYIDLSKRNNVDFFNFNRGVFESLIKTGKIDLHVHPVMSGDPYSIYAFELLAKSFEKEDQGSWDLLFNLVVNAPASYELKTPDDSLKIISDVISKSSIGGIDKTDLIKGEYSSWILSIENDKNVSDGFFEPEIYIDNSKVGTQSIDMNNKSKFRELIEKELERS